MILPGENQQLQRHDGRKTTVLKGKEEIEFVDMDSSIEVGQTMKEEGVLFFLLFLSCWGVNPGSSAC